MTNSSMTNSSMTNSSMTNSTMTIADLPSRPAHTNLALHCQATIITRKQAKDGKPYLDVTFSDGTSDLTLKCWSDSLAYSTLNELGAGAFYCLEGDLTHGKWGWEGKYHLSTLTDEEIQSLLAGPQERRTFLDDRWSRLNALVASMADAALRQVTEMLLARHEAHFRRAAAARVNHHARRGGLVEHVTEMAESASALCQVYPFLNRSLMIAAIVFHDCGKMLENNYQERGFLMPHNVSAALCGHIAIGFQIARDLWAECGLPAEDFRLVLLRHCILSHHGELEWGSPVQPMCMEAQVVHYIDQISAKLEMFAAALRQPEIAPNLHERMRPLSVHTVRAPMEAP